MSSKSNAACSELSGARVLVMGLGAHGGGAATARYCAEAGADVTVTDLRDAQTLQASVAALAGLPIRFVLGRHDVDDFRRADIVLKNPAVPRSAALLREARRIETDISLFLAAYDGPVLAITGTKGKSTTASALGHVLLEDHPGARLGGNITVSPLTFVHDLSGSEPVVLELSSFQLGDLLLTAAGVSGARPEFALSAITNLFPDHQDYYGSMAAYADDKAIVFSGQRPDRWCLLSNDDAWSRAYRPPRPERTVRISAGAPSRTDPDHTRLDNEGRTHNGAVAGFESGLGVLILPDGGRATLVPSGTRLPGAHMRTNLLYAGVAAYLFGVDEAVVRERLADFGGVPHRLETVGRCGGVRYVNDSAATIAEAALAAITSFAEPVHLIAGGSDKGVPLDDFATIARAAASLHLLEGTATDRIVALLDDANLPYEGPYRSLEAALDAASSRAHDGSVVLLSPGCASFGMFSNEFDRGDRFRRLVESRCS